MARTILTFAAVFSVGAPYLSLGFSPPRPIVGTFKYSTTACATIAPSDPARVFVYPTEKDVSTEVFARVDDLAKKAIAARGHFALAIPGGSILKMLANTSPDWSDRCTIAYVNHKCVSMDDGTLATHAKARALFLDAWKGVDVVTLTGSGDSSLEATAYSDALTSKVAQSKIPTAPSGLPCFDLALIGVGDDGHVGSLYPHRKEVLSSESWVLPVDIKNPGSITLSLPVMAGASEVIIAACGVSDKYPQGKSVGMARAIEGPESLESFPAVGLRGVATWIMDEAAASKLSPKYRR